MNGNIKRITALFLALLTALAACTAFAAAPLKKPTDGGRVPPLDSDFTYIRVLISTGGTTYINLNLYGEYRIGQTSISGTLDVPVRIKAAVSGTGVKVTNRSTGEVYASGSFVELMRVNLNWEAGWAQLTYCGNEDTLDRYYLGSFRFDNESGSVRMINTVHLAYYIYGIVGYELSPSSQPEALKAQAIAAKTLGMYYMGREGEWDVKDGWTSALYQAYRGFRENRLATMPYCLAVIGQALSYQGTIIPIFYGHTNGGETSLPSRVFGQSLAKYDGAYAVSIDNIEYDNYDQYRQLISVDFGGTGDSTRFLDFLLVKAAEDGISAQSVISIDDLYAYDPYPGTTRDMQLLHVRATLETAGGSAELIVDCPITQLRTLALTDMDGSGDSYSSSKYVFTKNYKLYWGKARSGGYTLIFARYGHGVGMSQIGADIRANPATYGWDYRQILAFYYPGMQLISVTEGDPTNAAGPVIDPVPVLAYGECSGDTPFLMGASTSYPSYGTVHAGEHIDVLGVTETGLFHAVWNGFTGYISMNYSHIVMFPAPTDGLFTVTDGATKSSCNLRAEPYIRDGNVIARLDKDTVFKAWAQIGKWMYITTEDGHEGFLSSVVANIYGTHTETGVSFIPVRAYVYASGAHAIARHVSSYLRRNAE